jgi:hypothetical protein
VNNGFSNAVNKMVWFFQRIDATLESGRLGRLINHAMLDEANLSPKKWVIDGVPRIVFLASKDIVSGTPLYYDYGERGLALKAWPWMRQSMIKFFFICSCY